MFGKRYRLEVDVGGKTQHVVFTQSAIPFNELGELTLELQDTPVGPSPFLTRLGANLSVRRNHNKIAQAVGHNDFTVRVASFPTPKSSSDDFGPSCC